MSLWPLFLISGAAVGYEIALTRYFAVAKWSEYGYWVISIVMVGFALSGVTVALVRDWAVRRGPLLLRWAPAPLVLAASGGYWATTANPFNPLQLQNEVDLGSRSSATSRLYYAVPAAILLRRRAFTSASASCVNADRDRAWCTALT